MYELSYFIHIAGIILWIGAFFSFGLLLTGMIKKGDALRTGDQIRKIVNRVILPSSIMIVLSGSYMISQFERGNLPFYLSLMEMAGSMIVLLSIIVLSMLSRKISKAVNVDKKSSLLGYYRTTIISSAVLALGVVLITALRLM
ncbi:hypothetical protein [Paenibacillus sp. Y412MC10]|uniref:hypothetical protein n=1 Tax=Geobacillus sp. (strain Y412MC10) TaxID=481743 RepID=UPI001642F411|nr:hypothetical protein [Paenibacillus sp. Y412MC10]